MEAANKREGVGWENKERNREYKQKDKGFLRVSMCLSGSRLDERAFISSPLAKPIIAVCETQTKQSQQNMTEERDRSNSTMHTCTASERQNLTPNQ